MDSIRDALLNTSVGRQAVIEIKLQKVAVVTRRNQVLDLIAEVFPGRPDMIYHARSVAHTGDVIRTGGQEFEHLVSALKFAPVDRHSALKALGLLKA